MSDIEDYIYSLEGEQRRIVQVLNRWLENELVLQGKIRYKIPFYYRKSWICYLNPVKNGKIELAFLRGNELSNIQGLLDFKDRKQVAGIEIASVAEIQWDVFNEIIQEAIVLDDIKPYKSKNKK